MDSIKIRFKPTFNRDLPETHKLHDSKERFSKEFPILITSKKLYLYILRHRVKAPK